MAHFYKAKIHKKQDGNVYLTIVVVNYLGQEIDNTGIVDSALFDAFWRRATKLCF